MIGVPIGPCLPLTGGTVSGELMVDGSHFTTNNHGDGAMQIYIGTDRAWTFRQIYSGAYTGLQLKSENAEKIFYITDNTSTFGVHVRLGVSSCSFNPYGNATLGTSDSKWGQIYSTVGSISTSDRNKKTDIEILNDKYVQLFNKLKPVLFKFKEENGIKHDRIHIGFISQDVEETMKEVGLTDLDFAGFCKDKVKKQTGFDENESPIYEDVLDEYGNPTYIYSLRYSEFIALNTHAIQNLMKRVDDLEKEVELLKS